MAILFLRLDFVLNRHVSLYLDINLACSLYMFLWKELKKEREERQVELENGRFMTETHKQILSLPMEVAYDKSVKFI